MFKSGNDLRKTIVLENDPYIGQFEKNAGIAKILEYSPDKIKIEANANSKSLLFLSDSYDPGWEATVNSVSVPIFRADYTFRAVVVEKGKNIVEFDYNPKSFRYGIFLAGVGIVLLFLFQKGLFLGDKFKP